MPSVGWIQVDSEASSSAVGGRGGHLLDLPFQELEEGRRVHQSAARLGEVRVVVRHPLAHPEQRRRLRRVVAVGEEVGRPQPLDVPGVEDLVRVERGKERRIERHRREDVDVRVLVLEPTRAAVRRVGDLHHRVRLPGSLAEDGRLGGNDARQPAEGRGAPRAGHRARGIGRQAYPPRPLPRRQRDAHAVDVEVPDEEGHVHQVVVVRRRVGRRDRTRGAGRGGGVGGPRRRLLHPGRHAPAGLGVHDDGRAGVEAAPLGVGKDVGAVEEREVGTRPRHRVVERVGDVVEAHRHAAAAGGADAPGVRVQLVPLERATASVGWGVVGDPLREVGDLVGARRPGGKGEEHRVATGHREAHLHPQRTAARGRVVEGDVVAHVGDRRRGRGRRGRWRRDAPPLRARRGRGRESDGGEEQRREA